MSNDVGTELNKRSLREEVQERVVTPQDILKRVKSPEQLERAAALVVDKNRWMVAAMVAMLFSAVLLMLYVQASSRAANNKELLYLKMYPDGHWDVDLYDGTSRDVEFMPATVDALISQFVSRRFQEVRESVRYDYGFAQLFMAPPLANAFVDPAQGNAVERAAEIRECPNCSQKQIEVGIIDHYDAEKTQFGKVEGAQYRTNVFVLAKEVDGKGTLQKSERKLVSMRWRLMSKQEIETNVRREGGVSWLRNNPIGLQILEYALLDDPSDQQKSVANQG